jgi:hypothetical protein
LKLTGLTGPDLAGDRTEWEREKAKRRNKLPCPIINPCPVVTSSDDFREDSLSPYSIHHDID